jgi:hypothetical protein
MRSKLSLILILLLLGGLIGTGAVTARQADQAGGGLFQASFSDGPVVPGLPATVQRSRSVTADLSAFAAPRGTGAATLALNPFYDATYTAVRDNVSQDAGIVTWLGHLDGIADSQVTLAVGGGQMVGTISRPGALYQVRYAGAGVHRIVQIDPTGYPAEHPPAFDAGGPVPDLAGKPVAAPQPQDVSGLIDVLVVWTPAAEAAAGGSAAMNNLVNLAIAESNTAYANSGIGQRLRLVYKSAVAYTESGTFDTDLARVTNPADGYMDNVPTLRNQYGADEVVLLINNTQYCGLAWLMTNPSPAFESNAYAVVYYDCATGYYSFAHELGHNMGSTHDRANAGGGGGSYPYSYGYQDPANLFRTVMAYDCVGGCPRIQNFSNPAVLYNGRPTGVDDAAANSANNAHSLNNTAPIVQNWRTHVVCAADFTDTPANNTFFDYITWMVCHGYVTGYPDGTFRPNNNVTRGQLMKMVVNAAGWAIDTTGGPHFVDVPATNTFYPYVETGYNHGVIGGYPCGGPGEPCPGTYFRPNNNITRSQLSKVIALAKAYPLLNPATPTFADVAPGSTFYQYVETVAAHSLVLGYPCGSPGEPCPGTYFRPVNSATRGQVSKIVTIGYGGP